MACGLILFPIHVVELQLVRLQEKLPVCSLFKIWCTCR